MMRTPKRCGGMYIMFDENSVPLYGFKVKKTNDCCYLENFVLLSNKRIDKIVLPKVVASMPYDNDMKNGKAFNYLKGALRIKSNCFKGIKEAKIYVPFDNSIMMCYGAFDDEAKIDFVTKSNLTLFNVYHRYDAGWDYNEETWTIIGDKNLSDKDFGNNSDCMWVVELDKENKKYLVDYGIRHFKEAGNEKQ